MSAKPANGTAETEKPELLPDPHVVRQRLQENLIESRALRKVLRAVEEREQQRSRRESFQ